MNPVRNVMSDGLTIKIFEVSNGMKIDRLILGEYETNCYIARNSEQERDCLIIDAGLQPDELIDFLRRDKLNPAAVVLTHGHIDHIAGVAALRKNFPDIKVYIHKLDAEMLTPSRRSEVRSRRSEVSLPSSVFRSLSSVLCPLTGRGDVIEQAGIKLQVLHTPGHTPGGICLYSKDEGIVFVGDTLFAGSVGRTDFPSGSMTKLIEGIREKLFTLPDETVVYPGHGPITTIHREKAHNPFLR